MTLLMDILSQVNWAIELWDTPVEFWNHSISVVKRNNVKSPAWIFLIEKEKLNIAFIPFFAYIWWFFKAAHISIPELMALKLGFWSKNAQQTTTTTSSLSQQVRAIFFYFLEVSLYPKLDILMQLSQIAVTIVVSPFHYHKSQGTITHSSGLKSEKNDANKIFREIKFHEKFREIDFTKLPMSKHFCCTIFHNLFATLWSTINDGFDVITTLLLAENILFTEIVGSKFRKIWLKNLRSRIFIVCVYLYLVEG